MNSYRLMVKLLKASKSFLYSADRTSIHAPKEVKKFYQIRADRYYRKAKLLENECHKCQDLANSMRYGN